MILERFGFEEYIKYQSTIKEYLIDVYASNFAMTPKFCDEYTDQKIIQLGEWLKSGDAILIGVVDKKLMGFVWFYKITNFDEERFHIYNIVVGSNYRGMGLSKLLIEEVKNLAVDMNVMSIELNVTASNNVAMSLYRTMGFEVERVKLKLNLEVG